MMPEPTITVTLSREEAEKVTALVELEARPGSPVPSPPVREVLASAGPKLRQALTSPQPERCDGSGQIPTGECRVSMSGPTCGIRRCPPCQSPETEPCPGCSACQPEQEGEAGDWPGAVIARDDDGALEVVAAEGDADEVSRVRAYEQGGYSVHRYVPAPAQHPTGLSEEEREQLRAAAKLLAQTTEGPDPHSDDLILFLCELADQQGRAPSSTEDGGGEQ